MMGKKYNIKMYWVQYEWSRHSEETAENRREMSENCNLSLSNIAMTGVCWGGNIVMCCVTDTSETYIVMPRGPILVRNIL